MAVLPADVRAVSTILGALIADRGGVSPPSPFLPPLVPFPLPFVDIYVDMGVNTHSHTNKG